MSAGTFAYTAVDAAGRRVRGFAKALDEVELDGDLESRSLTLVRARALAAGEQAGPGRLTRDETIDFTVQLAVLLEAGVPIVQGLLGIGERMRRPAARLLVEQMVVHLRDGEAFSAVVRFFPRVFPPVFAASAEAGEAAGSLDVVLHRLSRYMQWRRSIRNLTGQALIYPAILLLAITGMVTILMTVLLPRVTALFPPETELPFETRVVLSVSEAMRANVWLLAGIFVTLSVGLPLALRRRAARRVLHGALLQVPKLGGVVHRLATSNFASTAGTLLAAGCDVFRSLNLAADACGNEALADSYRKVAQQVRGGRSLTDSLRDARWSDPLLVQLVDVGERTGTLDACMDRLVRHYDEEIPRVVRRFLALAEPALLLAAGAVVGLILLATLRPIFQLYEAIG